MVVIYPSVLQLLELHKANYDTMYCYKTRKLSQASNNTGTALTCVPTQTGW